MDFIQNRQINVHSVVAIGRYTDTETRRLLQIRMLLYRRVWARIGATAALVGWPSLICVTESESGSRHMSGTGGRCLRVISRNLEGHNGVAIENW